MDEVIYRAPERIDAASYRNVEKELEELLKNGAKRLVFDMTDLLYISSAGLRVLVKIHKNLNGSGDIILKNVPAAVREILDMTGFSGMLTIK